jgi:hypothetical protein
MCYNTASIIKEEGTGPYRHTPLLYNGNFKRRVEYEHLRRNLSRDLTESELKEAFEAFGVVTSASIIKDRYTGESRGFGFVEMPIQKKPRRRSMA